MSKGFDWARDCLIDFFTVPEHLIKEEASLIDDIGLDSLDLTEVLVHVEDEFGEVEDEVFDAVLTVGDLAHLIDQISPEQVPA